MRILLIFFIFISGCSNSTLNNNDSKLLWLDFKVGMSRKQVDSTSKGMVQQDKLKMYSISCDPFNPVNQYRLSSSNYYYQMPEPSLMLLNLSFTYNDSDQLKSLTLQSYYSENCEYSSIEGTPEKGTIFKNDVSKGAFNTLLEFYTQKYGNSTTTNGKWNDPNVLDVRKLFKDGNRRIELNLFKSDKNLESGGVIRIWYYQENKDDIEKENKVNKEKINEAI